MPRHPTGAGRYPLDRKTVLLDEAQLERQREYTRQLAALHQQRGKPVYALVDTFGCQQNVADSQHILGMLRDMGCQFTDDAAQADIVVLNTCAIRDHAEKRVYGNLGALTHTKKQNPEQVICLCGCMAQRPEVAEKVRQSYRHVDLVFGPQALWKFPELLYRVYTRRGRVFSVEDEHGTIAEGMPVVREGNVRAWVSIMYGCNNFCSYCIVPYVRGRERSRRSEDVVREAEALVTAGYKDITLLGQNVNSYGRGLDEDVDFAELRRKVNAIPGDFRIRFMTSHPKDATERLFAAMAECEKCAPHIHLPVQSGSDRILRAMNRGYTAEKYLAQVDLARKYIPNLVLTTDVIVGFPGETEEDFLDTLALTEKVRFDSMFTFIYSRRPGTPAAKIEDDTPRSVIQNRFDRLVESAGRVSAELHRAQEGKTFRVLIDGTAKNGDYTLSARTAGGRLVHLRGDESLIGSWANARIVSSNTFALFGEITE